MYQWYKLLTYLFFPLSKIYLLIRKLKKKEHPSRYIEKLSKINIPRGDGFLVWIHAASVGETISVLPLVEYFNRKATIKKILITTITLSSSEVLKKKFPQNAKIVHQFLPLDIPLFINKFLNHWSPNLSIFIDSEIWPNLIVKVKKNKIPLLLVNGRITKKTFLRWMLIKRFAKIIFKKFDLCFASNSETENYLKILGAQNIKNHGNLKFASGKSIKHNKLNSFFLNKIKNRKVWCAASTHPTEELFCSKTHLKVKAIYPNALAIIIPRHIIRIKDIKKEVMNLNLKVELYSNIEKIDDSTDVLLVDSYGEASQFYNISECVFLGKSLTESLIDNSGQNPIEPSKLGCKIAHGPNVSNFFEIYKYLKSLNISKEVNTSNELRDFLLENFNNEKLNNGKNVKKIEDYGNIVLNNVLKDINKYINI